MAERERVTISIEATGTAKTAAELNAVRLATAGLDKNVKSLDRDSSRLSGRMNQLNAKMAGATRGARNLTGQMMRSRREFVKLYASTTDINDRMQLLESRMKGMGGSSKILTKSMRFLMFAVIGLGIEFLVTAASLMSVNLAFNLGKMAVKAYNATMAAGAAVVAAVGAALATAAAAQREYTAAQFAYTQKAVPGFGSAMDMANMQLRNLTNDTTLAVFGIQNLNAAFSAVSKNSAFTSKSQNMLRALADFAAIGGDPGKNMAAIGEFIGLLQKEGKVTAGVSQAAKAIGPEFEKAFKEIRKQGGGVEGIFGSILSGEMVKKANIQGQAELVSGTLFGTFKKFTTLTIGLFADIGQSLLGPANVALQKMFNILRNGIMRISPLLVKFGQGSFLNSIVAATEKITNFAVVLFEKYLPRSRGMMKGLGDSYQAMMRSLKQLRDSVEGLRDGGSVIIKMFGKPIMQLFKSIGDNVKRLSELSVEKKNEILEFGDQLAGFVKAIMDFSAAFKEAFVAALPTINAIVGALTKVVNAITSITKLLANMPFGGEALVGLAGLGVLKGRRGAQREAMRGGSRAGGFLGGVGGGISSMISQAAMLSMFTPGGNVPGGIGPGMTAGDITRNAAINRANRGLLSRMGLVSTGGRVQGALARVGSMFQPGAGQIAAAKTMYNETLAMGGTKGQALKAGAGGALKAGFSMPGMLAGMGLSAFAGSSMAPQFMKEQQGAINAGAMLMAINPALGLGVMGAGSLINTFQGKGAKTTAGGALSGAASGAALGAAIGSVIPGLGTAVGAIGGALIGGVVGMIGGNKAERMVAKEAAKAKAYDSLGKMTASLIMGDTGDARSIIGSFTKEAAKYSTMDNTQKQKYIQGLKKSGLLSNTQAERAMSHLDTFGKELNKQAELMQEAAEGPIKQMDSALNGLVGATGMSEEQILELAKKMNVNLADPALKLTDIIEKLGIQMTVTATDLIRSGQDILLSSTKVFDEIIKKDEILSAYDAAARKIREGGGTKEDYIDLFRSGLAFVTTSEQYKNDPIGAFFRMQQMYGAGGESFRGGGALAGREAQFRATGGEAAFQQYVSTTAGSLAEDRAGALSRLMISGGFEFKDGAAGFQDLRRQLQNMYSSGEAGRLQALQIEDFLASGSALGYSAEGIAARLRQQGLIVEASALQESQAGKQLQELSKDALELQSEIVEAVSAGFDTKPEWWENTPEWWSKEAIKEALGGDTSTPRAGRVGDTTSSRLERTMNRHAYFDGGLTGKRKVTSSYRSFGLGSINSDHVTGNAYDLTGQNLGQYASVINSAGGFAEFHGSASSRHLHVVPPTTPVGDTATSKSMPAIKQNPSMTASAQPMQVNVYGAQGQSELEIAKRVMNEISKMQRNTRERR